MKKNNNNCTLENKNKLVLRKDSVLALDNTDLSLVIGGEVRQPPNGGPPLAERQ